MNYAEAERWLFGRRRMGMKYGLDRMNSFMEDLGNPQQSFSTIHIVGTNGKGSTAAMLSGIAGELGISWGRTTSPHLLHYRERIAANSQWIPEESVARFVSENMHLMKKHTATFFEITTAMSAWYFAEKGVKWVAAEAGLGGRLDATRTFAGKATVFTGVQIEHSRILGNTRERIAAEKVAIAAPGTVLVTGKHTPGVEKVIEEAVRAGNLQRVSPLEVESSPLPGKHQKANGALALTAAVQMFGCTEEEVREAYAGTCNSLRWPGRLDYRAGSPSILFDVAHNPQSMEALANHVKGWKKPVPAVVGFLADKPWKKMVHILSGFAGPVFATTPVSERRLEAEELAAFMKERGMEVYPVPDIMQAMERCRAAAAGDRMIVTGSFYTVGDALDGAVSGGWVGGVPDSAGS